jgi:hypothetical protein
VLAIGWAQRKFKFMDRQCLQTDQTKTSWSYCAPGMYAGQKNPQNNGFGQTDTTSAGAVWAVGTVIGVWLNLENRTMSWSFNGKLLPAESRPVSFTNVPDDGFYPAISVGNAEVEVNFGAQPFKFHPNDLRPTAADSLAAASVSASSSSSSSSSSNMSVAT